MGLNDFWFILIGVLFAGFLFLEGFDFGVGILNIFIEKMIRIEELLLIQLDLFGMQMKFA